MSKLPCYHITIKITNIFQQPKYDWITSNDIYKNEMLFSLKRVYSAISTS